MEHEQEHIVTDPDAVETMPIAKKTNGFFVFIVAIVVLSAGFFSYKYLTDNKLKATTVDLGEYVPTVDVVEVRRVVYEPNIELKGEVMAATETELISEVIGPIIEVSPNLEVGSVLEKDELILRVDAADYRTALVNAQSNLADAELVLAQEQARAAQSLRDWAKLGRGKEASALVKREPQIKSAEARIEAAKAAIAKSERDVAKTVIRAPYRCMVDHKFTDNGAFLSSLSKIATVYSVSNFEVRLPVSLNVVGYLPGDNGLGAKVKLATQVGKKDLYWEGKVERFEGGIDSETASMIMVVSIEGNTEQGLFEFPPKGLFIDAIIKGEQLNNVLEIPREALRENDTVWVLGAENKLEISKVVILREEREYLYVEGDLSNGSKVIVSPIAVPVEGMLLDDQASGSDESSASIVETDKS